MTKKSHVNVLIKKSGIAEEQLQEAWNITNFIIITISLLSQNFGHVAFLFMLIEIEGLNYVVNNWGHWSQKGLLFKKLSFLWWHFFKAVKVSLSEVLTNSVIGYLYERLINIQHGEMIALSHSKLPALPCLTPHTTTQAYWYKSTQMH